MILKSNMNIRTLVSLFLTLSSFAIAETQPEEKIISNPEIVDVVYYRTIVKLLETVRASDTQGVKEFLSKEYTETGQKLKEMLLSQGKSVDDFDNRILRDFNFYVPTELVDITQKDDVALLEISVKYSPEFLERVNGKLKVPVSGSLWTSLGGKIFGPNWIDSKGGAIATFYLVRQDNRWRIHNVYFSESPLSRESKLSVIPLMQSLANGN